MRNDMINCGLCGDPLETSICNSCALCGDPMQTSDVASDICNSCAYEEDQPNV